MENYNVKVYENGKITLPSQIREILHISKGDEIILSLVDGKVVMTTYDYLLSQAQEKVRKRNEGRNLVEDLNEMRGAETNGLK